MAKIAFWYDLASSYSYLSAMRVDDLADERGLEVEWKPFLLGPIFAAQGWKASPFTLYPSKGRHMVRDMERICASRGLPFCLPEPFRQNSLHAARLALIGAEEGWGPAFSRALFRLEFGEGASLNDQAVLASALITAGEDPQRLIPRTADPEVKLRLKVQNETAQSRGLFGAPSFVTADGELFWGDDRLEQALHWR